MTEKWTNFMTLFSATLEKYGASFPSEEEMRTLLESIKEAFNDDIDNSDVSLQKRDAMKLYNEMLQKKLEYIYSQCKNKHSTNS